MSHGEKYTRCEEGAMRSFDVMGQPSITATAFIKFYSGKYFSAMA